MIRQSDGEELRNISFADPFFTRIKSLFDCYGTDYGFVRFYTQYSGEKAASFLSLFEGRMSLYLTEDSDPEEIESFILFSGCSYVMYNASFSLSFNSKKEINGDVLQYKNRSKPVLKNVVEPDIRSIYETLKACESKDFTVPGYLPFLSDVTHRKNRGKCTAFGIKENGVLASCAMTVSEAENTVIIGAVATRPAYRRRGLSRQVVISLSEKYAEQNKQIFVFSANEKNTQFYENSGFEKIYRFTEKQIG